MRLSSSQLPIIQGWTYAGEDGIPYFPEGQPQDEAEGYLRDHPVNLSTHNQADIDKGGPEEQVIDGVLLPAPSVPEGTNAPPMDLDEVHPPHYNSITSTHELPAINEN